MIKTLAVSLISCIFVLSTALVLSAGPLDRTNVQPRTNPTSQSMIRVPGVVGMDQQSAMSSIQQAGLSVSIKPSKKKPEGFEGKVVSQVPGAGGIAMYGTSVTIYVYPLPKVDPSGESMDNTTWGTQPAGSNPSYANPSTNGTTQPQQQYYPPASTGTPAQGSQQFQPQQYYYPPQDPNGAPATEQSGWGSTDEQQVIPDAGVQPQGEQGSIPEGTQTGQP